MTTEGFGPSEVDGPPNADASLDVSIEISDIHEDHPEHTMLAEDTRIAGMVQTASALVLAGEIEGEITSSGTIAIRGDGIIKGNVSAQAVEVSGSVKGEVRARRLSVGRTGRVVGNVTVERLAIDEGGVLEGRCSMKSG